VAAPAAEGEVEGEDGGKWERLGCNGSNGEAAAALAAFERGILAAMRGARAEEGGEGEEEEGVGMGRGAL
jgi:hypothetical protein